MFIFIFVVLSLIGIVMILGGADALSQLMNHQDDAGFAQQSMPLNQGWIIAEAIFIIGLFFGIVKKLVFLKDEKERDWDKD